jgi:hypothetical protein
MSFDDYHDNHDSKIPLCYSSTFKSSTASGKE